MSRPMSEESGRFVGGAKVDDSENSRWPYLSAFEISPERVHLKSEMFQKGVG